MIGIYKITSPSGKVYIGQSWNIPKRWNYYKSLYINKQRKLELSLLKYGVKNHIFEIIHELPKDIEQNVLDRYEQLYMDLYRDCGVELLNLKEGGSNGKLSEESKKKMSISRLGNKNTLGKKLSKEHKEKIGNKLKNRIFTEEHKNKLKEKRKLQKMRKGWKHSEESKLKISKAKCKTTQ